MAIEGFKCKLTAVFSADAVGYSRLMGEEEVRILRIMNVYNEVIGIRRIRWFHYEIGHEPWGGKDEMPKVPIP